ncbi:winged helix-turn-helix domain-containing protein [Neobacillus terrae]|uniref:winged helix-turn-helix domain-containing protein n=1 Tax=Neobacillus terrae TaxID=3034837 RepID=UPI00140BD057|nr:helix-turn-helix domain-containing protein [Neobacillus terrae]NHM32571.1 helix-turn-helix transcriptional regulator [Neobacillus terrae]
MKKIDDIEIAKMLLDPRKKSILDIAKTPVTVSQLAEELNEKPSRLYYHVKKLEDAELIELVNTRQHGNLIEKFYQTSKSAGQHLLELDEKLLETHHETVMNEIMKILQPGLKLLKKELENSPYNDGSHPVNLLLKLSEMTGQEWVLSQERIMKSLKAENDLKEVPTPSLTEEQLNMKSKYAYFLLSYRIAEED